MPDLIRHPCPPDSHAGLDPVSMRFYRRRMDSRVKHGNDRRGGVWTSRVRPVKQMLRFHGSSTGMTGEWDKCKSKGKSKKCWMAR
ncbi:MAG: hypothetical protein ISR54_08085 [Chlorobium phaeobacteroides]|nr:hypothetical protein [Chlorobium phaeobacteroides]